MNLLQRLNCIQYTGTWLLLTSGHGHSSSKLWRRTRFYRSVGLCAWVRLSCALSPKVWLSWLPCSAALKQLGEGGSGGNSDGGGGVGVCEWDAQWPRHHHKPPVWSNILTDELNECVANPSLVAAPSPASPRFSISQPPYWTAILPWVTTVAAVRLPAAPSTTTTLCQMP